jgi:hypothetical protein
MPIFAPGFDFSSSTSLLTHSSGNISANLIIEIKYGYCFSVLGSQPDKGTTFNQIRFVV